MLRNDCSSDANHVKPHLSLWKFEMDEETMSQFVELTRLHSRLGREFSQRETTPERRMAIKIQMENIRIYRAWMLEGVGEALVAP